MADSIENSENTIDVRDVIERFEELESDRENAEGAFLELTEERNRLESELNDPEQYTNEDERADALLKLEDLRGQLRELKIFSYDGKREFISDSLFDQDAEEEFESLKELLDDLKGYGGDHQWRGDWYPITLVRDSHFEEYAEEFAEGIGAINREATWPYTCIDWERAARELQMDFSTVELDGVTYWYR